MQRIPEPLIEFPAHPDPLATLTRKQHRTLATAAYALMEHPGRRVAAAEAALARLIGFCEDTAAAIAQRLQQQTSRADQAQEQLQAALGACIAGTREESQPWIYS